MYILYSHFARFIWLIINQQKNIKKFKIFKIICFLIYKLQDYFWNIHNFISLFFIQSKLNVYLICQFYIQNKQFLSHCNISLTHQSMIIMNNIFIHVNFRIKEVIEAHNCQMRYFFSHFFQFQFDRIYFFCFKSECLHIWI